MLVRHACGNASARWLSLNSGVEQNRSKQSLQNLRPSRRKGTSKNPVPPKGFLVIFCQWTVPWCDGVDSLQISASSMRGGAWCNFTFALIMRLPSQPQGLSWKKRINTVDVNRWVTSHENRRKEFIDGLGSEFTRLYYSHICFFIALKVVSRWTKKTQLKERLLPTSSC